MNWKPAQRTSHALQVHLLGPTELDAALTIQERTAQLLESRTDTYGVLLVCEHPSGITIGRDGSAADVAGDRSDWESKGVPVRWLRRGGSAWMHHAGQIVAYLVVPLERLGFSAIEHREHLIAALTAVGREQRVLVDDSSDGPRLTGRCGSLGFVGASVSEGITRFGGCLNVSVPREALNCVSWGQGVRPSSLAAECMRPVSMASVRECWIRHLAAQCGYSRYFLSTGHAWLTRTTRRTYVFSAT